MYIFACQTGGAGLSVVVKNDAKQESELTGLRRSVSTTDDKQTCYRHFFVEKTPPTGFKSDLNVRYICQGACSQLGQTSCFSTLYDLTYKIPIFSAYVLRPLDWPLIGTSKRGDLDFRKETFVLGEQQLYLLVIYLHSRNFLKNTS